MSRPECRMEACTKESRGRGLCSTHWRRWRTHGDPNVVKRPGVDYMVRRGCLIDGCLVSAHSHGYCPLHLARWQKNGDPTHAGPRTGRPLNGEFPTYGAIHKRLARTRGSAHAHRCVDCDRPAQEWSYDGTDVHDLEALVRGATVRYSLELEHYDPRCVSCHRKHDLAGSRPRSTTGQFSPITERKSR